MKVVFASPKNGNHYFKADNCYFDLPTESYTFTIKFLTKSTVWATPGIDGIHLAFRDWLEMK